MKANPDAAGPESAARNRRVAALAARVPGAPELCTCFDQAVEFAACEGKSIAEAIRDFFEDTGFPHSSMRPAYAALRQLVLPQTAFPPARLPVMPRAAGRLLRTTDETSSPAELEQIAGSDPCLAARLLGAANSARFGSRYEVGRLRDAVLRIGVPESRKVLLAACFASLFASKTLRELWEHSQDVAQAAFSLAGAGQVDPEIAYVAGLLHDIGRLAFTTFPASARIAEQEWLAAGFPVVYAESLVYGKDHAAFGAELLRGWDLPPGIVQAVALHHRPECSRSRLNAALHLAEDLATRTSNSAEEDLWTNMRRRKACDVTGTSGAEFDSLSVRRLDRTREAVAS